MSDYVEVKTEDSQVLPGYMGSTIRLPRIGWTFTWFPAGAGRWRWHGDHIDVGRLTVADFRDEHPLWRFIAWLIQPMRARWHRQNFGEYK